MKLPSPGLSFRSPLVVRKFVENFSTTDMDISNITRMISALRASTAPDSITPEGLGTILQHIADLIGALSQIDVSTETNLIARVSAAEGNAATALQVARGAAAAVAANVIDNFSLGLGSDNVTLTLQRHGYSAMTLTLQAATTTNAGVMSAEDKDHLDKAYQRTLYQLTTTSYDDRVTINYKRHNNQVVNVNFVGATSSYAGLMTAADKVKLDSIDATVTLIQQWRQNVTTILGTGVALLNSESGRIDVGYEYPVLLYGMGEELDGPDAGSCPLGGSYWDPETKLVWIRVQPRVSLPNSPSQNVVYTNFYTGKRYAWVPDQQEPGEGEMVEISDLPTIVNDTVTGGSTKILAAQQGVVLHQETELNKARYRNLCLAIKSSNAFSDLKTHVNQNDWDAYYPLILHLTGCTLQEEVPGYLGPMDSGTLVKFKAKTGYEVSVQSVRIYDGNGYDSENDLYETFMHEGLIEYNASTGLLTVTLEDPAKYEIFVSATRINS